MEQPFPARKKEGRGIDDFEGELADLKVRVSFWAVFGRMKV
jgi:hypothetical protein